MSIGSALKLITDRFNRTLHSSKFTIYRQQQQQQQQQPYLSSNNNNKQQIRMDHNLTSKQIRSIFIDYFKDKHDHLYVPSSSTIPVDDNTLLFTNAGMNQYKDIFLGRVDPGSAKATWKRTVNSQKCVRAGGKHNDLDDVGKDVYHHTFFEMLGNWSFGDYFKREAIEMGWDLLTNVYKIPRERLYVTYFGGDSKSGLDADLETKQIWLDIGIPESRVLPFDMRDNFWEMGETGPCGPCSEIHFDRIGDRDAAPLVNMDDPDVLEIWNLVFIQFDRQSDNSLKLLPKKHVDTGMGFERLTSVIQGKRSNYDTDLFQPIFHEISQKCSIAPYSGLVGEADINGIDMAYRVVADHIRTLTITLSDGGRPDQSGQGYVLKRLLRRAVRYATEKLNASPGVLGSLVHSVVAMLGDVFPEVTKCPDDLQRLIDKEERQFLLTLKRGVKVFSQKADSLIKSGSTSVPGDLAWQMYDTYGFPLDLTRLMAEEKKLCIDQVGYESAKLKAQAIARGETNVEEVRIDLDVHSIDSLKNNSVPLTDDVYKYSYETDNEDYRLAGCEGTVLAILLLDKQFVGSAANQAVGLVLDKTCFYAENGGQLCDTGFISKGEEVEVVIDRVQVKGGYVIHVGQLEGTISVGDTVTLDVNEERRRGLMNNHTGTHVLNFGLRSVLGNADQRGSLVAPDRLRFDFTADQPMTTDQVKSTEGVCQTLIRSEFPVYTQEIELARAKEVKGLRAMFEEGYPEMVRMVTIGIPIDTIMQDPSGPTALQYSVELCGGTHLRNSKHILELAIMSQEPNAAGVRRIEAVTGREAVLVRQNAVSLGKRITQGIKDIEDAVSNNLLTLKRALTKLSELKEGADGKGGIKREFVPIWFKDELREKLDSVKDKFEKTEREQYNALKKIALQHTQEIIDTAQKDNKFLVFIVKAGAMMKALEESMKKFKADFPQTPVLLLSSGLEDGQNKIICYVHVPKSVVQLKEGSMKASEWVHRVMPVINGKGGGRDMVAQGTGTKVEAMDEAIQVATIFAKEALTVGKKSS
ncbi:Alanine-tRNA ligase, cytoplasmic-like [Oopsacas minuta]|uniref:Alanine--tRNA ligase n=1 Tax=Oopsacas minuta TaxID=111878 RepID=A0AAV7K0L1_9METZ|nr:Alanine-tRNA ligase, cytoplasmic-like [Oopsacas minuta]